MVREPTPEPIEGKIKKIVKSINTTYLETVAETSYQLVPPEPRIKNILVTEDDYIAHQIIYTPEEAADCINAILKIYPTAQHILDMHEEPREPNKWEVAAWKVRDVLDFQPYKLRNTEKKLPSGSSANLAGTCYCTPI